MFQGWKPELYDSWGDYSEYVVGYNDATCRNYITRWEAEVAYAVFLQQHNKNCKPEQVAKFWSWKDLVILVKFVVIVSYPIFMPKSSTNRMHDPQSIVPHIRSKVFTDN
jgi:hypothetical protein